MILNHRKRECNGVSILQVVNCVLNTTDWKRSDTLTSAYFCCYLLILSEAACIKCCPNGESLVQLTFAKSIEESPYDIIVFEARPRCSSTRIHHNGAKIVMVTNIPHLSTPLASIPITFNARARRFTNKSLPAPLPASTILTPDQPTHTTSQLSSALCLTPPRRTFHYVFPPTLMPVVSGFSSSVPPGVVATATHNVLSFSTSSLLNGSSCFFSKSSYLCSLMIAGPVVNVSIVYTTCIEEMLKRKPPAMSPVKYVIFTPLPIGSSMQFRNLTLFRKSLYAMHGMLH